VEDALVRSGVPQSQIASSGARADTYLQGRAPPDWAAAAFPQTMSQWNYTQTCKVGSQTATPAQHWGPDSASQVLAFGQRIQTFPSHRPVLHSPLLVHVLLRSRGTHEAGSPEALCRTVSTRRLSPLIRRKSRSLSPSWDHGPTGPDHTDFHLTFP